MIMINNNYFSRYYYFNKYIVATLFYLIQLKVKKLDIELLHRNRQPPQRNLLLSQINRLLSLQPYSLIFKANSKPDDYM